MAGFAKTGALEFTHAAHKQVRNLFAATSVDEHETAATIASTYKATGRIVDPHTAVGLAAAARLARPEEAVVTLATAHPAKFPDAVFKATGQRPGLPASMKAIETAPERYATLPNDAAELKRFIQKI
jgi:threonine synthase